MSAQQFQPKASRELGHLLTEGKTRWVYQAAENHELVVIVAKDDITASHGKKHDISADKGQLANRTTCNVFRLLQSCDIPVAFVQESDDTSFVAPKCQMLPYEVVVRREAHGYYLDRNPQIAKGQLFSRLIVEFFLKTKGRRWKQHELTCDDPLLSHTEGSEQIQLFHPATPSDRPFLELPTAEVFGHEQEGKVLAEMHRIARRAFLVLEKAWQIEGQRLVDYKTEFGFDAKGNLLLADAIDNDSWRVVESNRTIDKQMVGDGSLNEVAASYRRVAEITSRFRVPDQRIILWRGSDGDNVEPFTRALGNLDQLITVVTCSAHKEPVMAMIRLHLLVQETPDSVVVAYIGRSNGAGPTLSAMSTVPVITVPASIKEFPDDVWSSLRAPSKVPVMTVLEPANAILAALQILSARNPRIYAQLREELETRMVNTIQI